MGYTNVLRQIAAAVKRAAENIERDEQHIEGAARHAATLVGEGALNKGKTKEDVSAVIESSGARACGLKGWQASAFIVLVEAFLIGTQAERFGIPLEQADFQYMRNTLQIAGPSQLADVSGACSEDEAEMRVGRLSLIHISEPTRPRLISYAVFCLKK